MSPAEKDEEGSPKEGKVNNVENEKINLTKSPSVSREKLISTAVHFLQNPRIINSPLSQKRTFLLNKGLTGDEIDIAIERANISGQKVVPYEREIVTSSSIPYSRWNKWKEIWSSIVIIGATFYGAYKLYKYFIEPALFGESLKDKRLLNIESQMVNVNDSLASLRQSLLSVQESLVQQQQQLEDMKQSSETSSQEQSLCTIKSEIASLKAILLSRHQFPSSKVSPPSIPTWQMVESNSQNDITTTSVNIIEEPTTVISSMTILSDSSTEMIEDPENKSETILTEDGQSTT